MDAQEVADVVLDGIAVTLAWFYPEVWPKLQVAHVPDDTGHCQACYSYTHGRPVWPCRLRCLADDAELITRAARAEGVAVLRAREAEPKPEQSGRPDQKTE